VADKNGGEKLLERALMFAKPARTLALQQTAGSNHRRRTAPIFPVHQEREEVVAGIEVVKPVATEPTDAGGSEAPEEPEAHIMRCPKCGGVMKLVGDITPKRTRAP